MITQKSIQEVIDTANIEDVVKDYVDLKKRGANMLGLCPFHREKTPSFTVSVSKNIFKCFGCGKGGTPVQFVMEIEQMSFPEAIRHLAKKYNIQLDEITASEISNNERSRLESLNVINEFALQFYQSQLWDTDKGKSIALDYLKARNFLELTIRKFQLGYSPDENLLLKTAIEQQYNIELLKELGLVTNAHHDFFKQRVIFPIHNVSGKVIGFAGRTIGNDKKSPKYINSPETILYNKSKCLFGLHLAKKAIRDLDRCILVEGYTDAMALVQAGFENVVATSGTALTEDQAHLLRRYCKNVTLLYDGDDAGIKASIRGLDILIKEDLNVSIAVIPDGDDPDSFLKKVGSEAFSDFLQRETIDFILFLSQYFLKDAINDPIKKAQTANEIIKIIAKIPDAIKRNFYIKECAELFQIKEVVLINACNKIIRADKRSAQIFEDKAALDRDREILESLDEKSNIIPTTHSQFTSHADEFQERDIARIIMLWGDKTIDGNMTTLEFIFNNISDVKDFIEIPLYKKVIEYAQQCLSENYIPNLQSYLYHQDRDISSLCLEFTINKHEYSSNWEKRWGVFLNTQRHPDQNFIKDCLNAILRFKLKKFNKQISYLEAHIKTLRADDEDLTLLLKTHNELLGYRNQLAKMLKTVVIN